MAIFELKAEREAPSNTKGLIHWLKDNLFSTPSNAVMTLLGFYILYIIIPPFIQWAYTDATFVGETRADCTGGGACWVFVGAKMDLFMYGFYPKAELWRLQSALGLFVALIVAFKYFLNSGKSKFIVFSLYLIVAFVLIIGGIFGLENVPTDKWGGLMLTIVVAAVGIIFSFPIGIIIAFGRA